MTAKRVPLRQISVRIDESEANQVEKLAQADGRSVTNYVRRLIQQHIEEVRER